MAWTKVEHDLRDKPEVIAIAAALTIPDRDLVVGKLIRLWQWFDKNTSNGCAHGVTQAFIDSHVALDGFAAALENVGWLSVRNGCLEQPNFDRHNSKSAKARALANERVKRSRYVAGATKALPEKNREEKNRTPLPPLPALIDKEPIRTALADWLAYKAERRESYKPVGLRAFVSRVEALTRKHGQQAIVGAMQRAMASNWQGWEHDVGESPDGLPPPAASPAPPPGRIAKANFAKGAVE